MFITIEVLFTGFLSIYKDKYLKLILLFQCWLLLLNILFPKLLLFSLFQLKFSSFQIFHDLLRLIIKSQQEINIFLLSPGLPFINWPAHFQPLPQFHFKLTQILLHSPLLFLYFFQLSLPQNILFSRKILPSLLQPFSNFCLTFLWLVF